MLRILLTHLLFWHLWWVGAKLEAVSNCGLHKIFLLLPFFNIDSRKLFCFSYLFAASDFFFGGEGFSYFVLLEWGKGFYVIISFYHPRNTGIFFQFLLKILLSSAQFQWRDKSGKRLQLQAKMFLNYLWVITFSILHQESKQLVVITLTLTKGCYNFLYVAMEARFCGSGYLCFHE